MQLTDNTSLFYADDGLVSGTDRAAIQFCVKLLLTFCELFGLQMNASKTKAMVGCPRISPHRISTPAFNRRLLGEGRTYSSNNRQLVPCDACGLELQQKSLKRHQIQQHQHYKRPNKHTQITQHFYNPTNHYTISMDNTTPTSCPVPNCLGIYNSRISMQTHFQHRHWGDVITINEEGPLPR
jgi:hypothetical protein